MNYEANNQGGAATERINTASLAVVEQGGAVQQVGTQYSTAVQVQIPRDLANVEERCLVEANLAGDTIYYGFPAGDGVIEGPSIDCAMILLRNFGNAALAQRPVIETEKAFIFCSVFIDVQTGATYERQFRQSKKSKVGFRTDDARKEEIRFQIGQSKSDRNVILKAVPRWLSDKMIAKAKEGVRAKIEKWIKEKGIVKASEVMAKELLKFGIDEERVEVKYGKKRSKWGAHELTLMSGDLKALQNGYDTAEAIFPIKTIEVKADVIMTGQSMTIGDPGAHTDHEGELSEKPKSDTPTGIEPKAKKPKRKEILAEIKKLEASENCTDEFETNLRAHLEIKNLSRTAIAALVKYRNLLQKGIKALPDKAPEPEPEEDLDEMIEEIIALEQSTGLSASEVEELGDKAGMDADLTKCTREQLTTYRNSLKAGKAGKPKTAIENVADMEKQYATHLDARDLVDLREQYLGVPELDVATPDKLISYYAVLDKRVAQAKVEKEEAP